MIKWTRERDQDNPDLLEHMYICHQNIRYNKKSKRHAFTILKTIELLANLESAFRYCIFLTFKSDGPLLLDDSCFLQSNCVR